MECERWVRFPNPDGGVSHRIWCTKKTEHQVLHSARVEAITGGARVEVSLCWTTPGVEDESEEDSVG